MAASLSHDSDQPKVIEVMISRISRNAAESFPDQIK